MFPFELVFKEQFGVSVRLGRSWKDIQTFSPKIQIKVHICQNLLGLMLSHYYKIHLCAY
jgi:hypothetical protein